MKQIPTKCTDNVHVYRKTADGKGVEVVCECGKRPRKQMA